MPDPYDRRPDAVAPAANTKPYSLSGLSPRFELVDLAKLIADADTMVDARVRAQIQVIAEQIRALQRRAHFVLEKARQGQALNHAECSFTRIPGKVYHPYLAANERS